MRPVAAWTVSLVLGVVAYALILVLLQASVPILPEGRWAERTRPWSLLPLPAMFLAVAAAAPRPWAVPAGVLLGALAFAVAVAWGGLWGTGPGYEGPGPGFGVIAVGMYGLMGSLAGAILRTLWLALRRPLPE